MESQWRVSTSSSVPPNLTRTSASVDSPARLIIPATPQYNHTVVQCVAHIVGKNYISENATLKIQGVVFLSSILLTIIYQTIL